MGQRAFPLHQGNRIGVAVRVVLPLVLVLHAHLRRMEIFAGFEHLDPLVEGFVGIGFADEDEEIVVEQGAATEGLMSIEIVAQQRVMAGVVRTPRCSPASAWRRSSRSPACCGRPGG